MPGNPLVRFDEGRVGRTSRATRLGETLSVPLTPLTTSPEKYPASPEALSPPGPASPPSPDVNSYRYSVPLAHRRKVA